MAWYGMARAIDFQYRQYPQIVSGQYTLMHTLAHTLLCKGVLSVWPGFQAIVLVQLGLLLSVCFMIVSWAARERMRALIVLGAVLLCLFQFEMVTTVIKDVPLFHLCLWTLFPSCFIPSPAPKSGCPEGGKRKAAFPPGPRACRTGPGGVRQVGKRAILTGKMFSGSFSTCQRADWRYSLPP